MQKYSCRGCGRSFNPLTGTLFGSRKIPLSEWVEFLLQFFDFHSAKTSARDNRNAESAEKYWLAKVFSALEGCQDGGFSRAGYGSTRPSSRSTPRQAVEGP